MKIIKKLIKPTIILSFFAMAIFLILLILKIDNDSIWSALVGIFASFFFSASISYIVQKINDDREANNIMTIRSSELEKLSIYINSFISTYHDCEVELNKEFSFIKDSFINNTMDLNIIRKNLYCVEELKNKNFDEQILNKLNDYSFQSEKIRKEYNKMAKYIEKQVNQLTILNNTYHMNIFDKEEIATLSMILPIKEDENIDIFQAQFYLENLFSLIKKFDLKLNIYVNYEWIFAVLILMDIYNEKSLETEKENAKRIVNEYLNNKN